MSQQQRVLKVGTKVRDSVEWLFDLGHGDIEGEWYEEDDQELLQKVLRCIRDVKKRTTKYDDLIEPLRAQAMLLKKFGIIMPEEIIETLEMIPFKWEDTKKVTINAREQLGPLQSLQQDKLREKFRVDPTHLVEHAESLGQMWVDTLRNVTAAAGRKPLVVYYEALQVNPKREMRRVFTFAGLPPATKIKAESTSKKLTPEDLRATLLDFGKTAKFLRERRPGLHDQLVDTAHRVFKTLHLPGNRTGNFEEYEH